MNELIGKQITREHPPEPVQQFLKGLVPWPGGKLGNPFHQVHAVKPLSHYTLDAESISERSREVVATQLATSLRMQGLDEESNVMLGLLLTLVQVGEIAFRDYVGRVHNLFPE